MTKHMALDRCRDCGGLWKKRNHQEWCRHFTPPPDFDDPQYRSSPPDALAIHGPMRYGHGTGEMRVLWFDGAKYWPVEPC